jgi:hypothetical protein
MKHITLVLLVSLGLWGCSDPKDLVIDGFRLGDMVQTKIGDRKGQIVRFLGIEQRFVVRFCPEDTGKCLSEFNSFELEHAE